MNNLIFGPWPWFVVGPIIAILMLSMYFMGKSFGVSSNFRTICTIMGADKFADYFKFDWKAQTWNLVFIFGTLVGGFIAHNFMMNYETIDLSKSTVTALEAHQIKVKGVFSSPEFFSWESFGSLRSIIMIVLGGFFVGFGTRYAGGCTSGHAITGLSNLQMPSLVAVIGFFIGGLLMTWLILPLIFQL